MDAEGAVLLEQNDPVPGAEPGHGLAGVTGKVSLERLVAPLGVNAQRAVVLEQDHAIAGTQPRRGAAVVGDLAAGDEDPHAGERYRGRMAVTCEIPMSGSLISHTDFVFLPITSFERAEGFYAGVLGLPLSKRYRNGIGGEFETGNLTILLLDMAKIGREFAPSKGAIALRVDDVEAARAQLEARGVRFQGEILDSGVCHQAIFEDPDGNMLILHHRYAPPDAAR